MVENRVEGRAGFIHQHDVGLNGNGPGAAEALLLPPRQRQPAFFSFSGQNSPPPVIGFPRGLVRAYTELIFPLNRCYPEMNQGLEGSGDAARSVPLICQPTKVMVPG